MPVAPPQPAPAILILECSDRFKRRVGESTVEVSSYFLDRVLGLSRHLHEKHLTKQGLRFWFHNEHADSLDTCSETDQGYNVRPPAIWWIAPCSTRKSSLAPSA